MSSATPTKRVNIGDNVSLQLGKLDYGLCTLSFYDEWNELRTIPTNIVIKSLSHDPPLRLAPMDEYTFSLNARNRHGVYRGNDLVATIATSMHITMIKPPFRYA
jgi:hypothetical protein